MKTWVNFLAVAFVLATISGCTAQLEEAPTHEFVNRFREWPIKQQVKYFNGISKKSRLDLLASMLSEGGEFTIGDRLEIKFFPDGEFVYDVLTDQGYKAGGNSEGDPVRFFIGHWNYKDGKIYLQDDPLKLKVLSDGYIWVDAQAEIFQGKNLDFAMNLGKDKSPDAWEDTLSMVDRLDSPAIRSYAEKKKGGVLAGGE